MFRFRRSRSPLADRPSSPLLRGAPNEASANETSTSASTSRQPSSESLSASLTSSLADSIANSTAYSVATTAPRTPTVPLATLIHPLRYLSSSLYSRIYEVPRRQPRILKVC